MNDMPEGANRPPVAVLGLGRMGSAIAERLVRSGFPVSVWNRSERGAPEGSRRAGTPADAVTPGGIALSLLADDAAVEAVMLAGGVAERLGRGLHLSMSTLAPATTERLAAVSAGFGGHLVAAPVFGRPAKALEGQLFIAASGPAEGMTRAEEVFAALARGVARFGEAPAAAPVVKLAMNFMGAAAIEAIGEACALVGRHGVDRTEFLRLVTGSVFDSYNYRLYSGLIDEGRYEPAGFSLELGWKDLRLALDAAGAAHVPMPFGSVLRDRLLAGLAAGRGGLDWTAIALGALEAAGSPDAHPGKGSKDG